VPDATTVYVIGVIFVATLIRSTMGFGEALFAVPMLAFRIPITIAAPLAVLVSVLIAAVVVAQDWRHVHLRATGGLVVSSLLGIPLGILLLTHANEHLTRALLGVVIVLFAVFSLAAGDRFHLERDRPLPLLGAGFFAGVLGGAYGMNGPPLAIYGALRRWSPQQFRANLQGYFLPASVAGLVGYAAVGLWVPAVTRYFLLSLPGIVVAVAIGRALNRRFDGGTFLRFVYAGLIVIGASLTAQGLIR
jgi:uncharacterized protein